MTATKQCFGTTCRPKDALTALNTTTVACNEPIRNKWKTYRLINVVFFVLAVSAIAIRWTTVATIGRVHWLDEANMAIVLVSNVLSVEECISPYTGFEYRHVCHLFDNVYATRPTAHPIMMY